MADALPTDPGSRPETTRRRWPLAILAAVLIVHAVQAIRLFPGLGSIVDAAPVVMVDHALHLYHGALGARFLRERGATWGYDPAFMAGYPETPVWDSSSNLSILSQWLAGGYSPRAYKLVLLACSLGLMAAAPAGAWALGLGAAEAAGATAVAWLYFWCGYPASLWRSGLFAFTTVSAGAGLLLGLCVRFDLRPGRRGWLAIAGLGSALLFAHVTAPIILVGGLLPFYAASARRHGPRWHAAMLGAAVVALSVNLVWLVPLWRFRAIREGGGLFITADSARFLVDYYVGGVLDGPIALVILIAGLAGLALWAVGGRRAAALAIGGASATMLVLAGFGSLWAPTRVLEPLRFLMPLNLLLAIPAGSALARATARTSRLVGGGLRGAAVAALAWLAALGAAGAAIPKTAAQYARDVAIARPLAVGLTPEMTGLVGWLRSNTDPSARILFEDQLRLLESTDPESVHWTPLLPVLLGPDARGFIGGLYQTAFIRHHAMASFGDFHLGGRFIDAWGPGALLGYCDIYNVGWVVCWSPLSRFWFDRFEPARRVATLPRYASPGLPSPPDQHAWDVMARRAGAEVALRYATEADRQYAIYRVERPRTFFLRGTGRVVAMGPDRVELADLVPDGGSVVISLHWLDAWRADPPLAIGPQTVQLDPVEFVRIDCPGPVPGLVLFNGGGRR